MAAGIFIYRGARDTVYRRTDRWYVTAAQVLFILFLSQLPDLDSIAGMFSDDFGAYHNQFSHSLLTGIPIALLVAGGARLLRSERAAAWGGIALISYELHVVMDYFTVGRGVRLFWPLSGERFQSPIKLFYGLHWSEGWLSMEHVRTALTEGLFIAVVAAVWILVARRRNRHD